MLSGIKKAVMFCAHTDDEMVSAGTLHRLVRQGCEVHVVAYGPAAVKEDRAGSHDSVRVVLPEWHAALDLIGVKQEHRKFCNFVPSARLEDYRQDVCQVAYDYIEMHKPDAVFTLSPDDENTAHAVVGRETERVMRGRVPIAIRCLYPWNYSIGRPNLYVKLDDQDVAVKESVIMAYKSQAPAYLEAGGKFRYNYLLMLMSAIVTDGQSVKVSRAEKFEMIRGVV